ncbi:hypothetical protein [Actinobaculum sp. 352]|uniref:hypothetical protein n=1 Tax=Actinobaculum sp. 352 TaxID=2490946 RepID=UPI000F7DE6F9|nr:hypothetical protein [Actinobaculum sp. 352]RTE48272.1 hypothetical protein EKN07_10295 [Actinobaculum sp. 352]
MAGQLLAGCSGQEASAPQTGMALPTVATESPHTQEESIVGFVPANQLRDSLGAGGDIAGYAKVTIHAGPSSHQIFNLGLEFSCVITSDSEPVPASDGGSATVEVSITLERQYLPSAFDLPDELAEDT